jgi:hypothetical protein
VSAYLWGNLVGRLIASWALVFVATLLIKKGRFKAALRASVWPWGWLFILLLFALALLSAVAHTQSLS